MENLTRKRIFKFIFFPILVIITLIIEKSIENTQGFMTLVKILKLILQNLTLIVSILSIMSMIIMVIYWKIKDKFKDVEKKRKETEKLLVQLIHEVNLKYDVKIKSK